MFKIQLYLIVGFSRNEITQLRATGCPQDVYSLNQLNDIRSTMEKMSDDIPNKTADEILRKCNVDGAAVVTMDKMKELFQQMFAQHGAATAAAATATATGNDPNTHIGKFKRFKWNDGTIDRMVPEGWRLHIPGSAKLTVNVCWSLWCHGNVTTGIQPYRHLSTRDLNNRECRQSLSRMRKIMKLIEFQAMQRRLLRPEHIGQQLENSPELSHTIFHTIMRYLILNVLQISDKQKAKRDATEQSKEEEIASKMKIGVCAFYNLVSSQDKKITSQNMVLQKKIQPTLDSMFATVTQ
jgi:hypothetical protein